MVAEYSRELSVKGCFPVNAGSSSLDSGKVDQQDMVCDGWKQNWKNR
jgi:hypothetical protein